MDNFEPWNKYTDLTRERLSAVANIIRCVRRDALNLHEPTNGDNEWSLGCRVYARTCYAIREDTKNHPWLSVLPEPESLRFSFAIGAIPFRFYKGDPSDPPGRYLIATYGELHHHQLSLAIEGLRPLDKILRLAVEVDSVTREVSAVTLVEMDDAGNRTETYSIPFDAETDKITSIQAKPVDLPPPTVEPLASPKHAEEPKKADERTVVSK